MNEQQPSPYATRPPPGPKCRKCMMFCTVAVVGIVGAFNGFLAYLARSDNFSWTALGLAFFFGPLGNLVLIVMLAPMAFLVKQYCRSAESVFIYLALAAGLPVIGAGLFLLYAVLR